MVFAITQFIDFGEERIRKPLPFYFVGAYCFIYNSDLVMSKLREDLHELPVCPKPRRIRSAVPEFIEPLAYSRSHSKGEGSRISEVIDMISNKTDNGQEPLSCSPSYYCGSPPTRTNNPLVHDVQFIHQMELLPPFTRPKLSDRLGLGSASPA